MPTYITVNRESVCMGDDVNSHAISFEVLDNDTFTDVLKKLITMKYFPNISGNDVVWVLMCSNDDLVSWLTKSDKIYTRFVTSEPFINSTKAWKGQDIFFRYYSPIIKRAKYIFDIHSGNKFHIWHEGFMPEYEAYCVDRTNEDEWSTDKN